MEEILTAQEVADYLRVSRATVWRWCSEGELKAFKAGRSWRIRRSELERFVEYQSADDSMNSSRNSIREFTGC